jgi:beta-mannosidase
MAFSPQYAFTVVEPRSFRVGERIDVPLYVVNDAQQAIPHVRLLASLRDPDGGLLARVEHSLTLAADCMAQEVDRLRLTPTRPGRYALELELGGVAEPVHQIYEIEVV